jgi:hypothetical protein
VVLDRQHCNRQDSVSGRKTASGALFPCNDKPFEIHVDESHRLFKCSTCYSVYVAIKCVEVRSHSERDISVYVPRYVSVWVRTISYDLQRRTTMLKHGTLIVMYAQTMLKHSTMLKHTDTRINIWDLRFPRAGSRMQSHLSRERNLYLQVASACRRRCSSAWI